MRFLHIILAATFCGLAAAIVPTMPEVYQFEETCSDIMDASPTAREGFRRHHFPDNQESRWHGYCTVVLAGFYSERTGWNLEKSYELLNATSSWDTFKARHEKCFREKGVYEAGVCRYDIVWRIYQCFYELGEFEVLFEEEEQGKLCFDGCKSG